MTGLVHNEQKQERNLKQRIFAVGPAHTSGRTKLASVTGW